MQWEGGRMSAQAADQAERALIDAVSADELMASTRAIARWVRLSGTDEEARAFDWIEQRLKEFGLETRRYSHPALVSWPESASLTLSTSTGDVEIPCATHAFATSTPEGGLEGELVSVGRGSAAELARADVRGKIALVEGIVAPNRNLAVEQAGVAGSIWIAGSRLHERALSPVWGTPTPETAHLLPKTPSVSVVASEGARIKEALARGPVRARLHTRVYQGWRHLPCLTGDLRPTHAGPETDLFVLFSGHVDSWYHGAMDNGTANATMLEVSRLLAQHREELRRGMRVAFWSGHSHARYAGSTWYADTFWHELHDRCVAHVNVDSVGGKGATVLSEGNSMSQLRAFGSAAIEQVAGQRLAARRYGRAGDQSFWGHGIPAMLMSLSEQPPENADPILLALHHQISGGAGGGGGLGPWWHTPEDTVDKIDPDFLRRDATIYTLLLYRLCTLPILPLDYAAVVDDLAAVVAEIAARAGDHFDLRPVADELSRLDAAVQRLQGAIAAADTADAQTCAALNRCLMRLGHALIPTDYTTSGPFDHDGAVPTRPLPSLQPAAGLSAMDPESDAYHFLVTRLVRERNRIVQGLREATAAIDETLADGPKRRER